MSSTTHNQWLAIRLNREHKSIIAQAADMLGLSLSAFTVSTLVDRAQQVLGERAAIEMNNADRDRFLSLLDNPPRPNERLRRTMQRHSESVVK